MMMVRKSSLLVLMIAAASMACPACPALSHDSPPNSGSTAAPAKSPPPRLQGKASYYGKHFAHKKTASGEPLDPNKKTAASKTLPIGTKAKVINKENGKSTEVVVTDRGPYVKDRIIDVTPKAAEELDMKKEGVTPVEVKPIEVPKTEEQKKEAVKNPPQ